MQFMVSARLRRVAALSLVAGVVALTPSLSPGVASTSVAASSPRSGDLHATKDCTGNTPYHVGGYCTIMTSNLKALEVGSRINYLQPLTPNGSLDTAIAIDVRPGNTVFGHCNWPSTSPTGLCTLSGGTGMFTHFHASVVVAYLGGTLFSWNGTYSFSPQD